MDDNLIIETLTEVASETKQLETHLARVQKYRDLGYPVVEQSNGEFWVYPKNALTGESDMTVMPTKLWAEPELSPDNTYEIPVAPDVTPAYTGNDQWDYTIRERPTEWSDPAVLEDTEFNTQFKKEEFK